MSPLAGKRRAQQQQYERVDEESASTRARNSLTKEHGSHQLPQASVYLLSSFQDGRCGFSFAGFLNGSQGSI